MCRLIKRIIFDIMLLVWWLTFSFPGEWQTVEFPTAFLLDCDCARSPPPFNYLHFPTGSVCSFKITDWGYTHLFQSWSWWLEHLYILFAFMSHCFHLLRHKDVSTSAAESEIVYETWTDHPDLIQQYEIRTCVEFQDHVVGSPCAL